MYVFYNIKCMGKSYWKMKCIIYFETVLNFFAFNFFVLEMSILRPVCSSVPLLFWILLDSRQTAVILVLVMEFYTCLSQHTPNEHKRFHRCVCVCVCSDLTHSCTSDDTGSALSIFSSASLSAVFDFPHCTNRNKLLEKKKEKNLSSVFVYTHVWTTINNN